MAKYGFGNVTKERKAKIIEEVKSYFYWRDFQGDWKEIEDWDGNKDTYYLSDCVDDFFDEYRHYNRKQDYYTGKFYCQITSCIRAGIDVAVEPSGGVLGFTAGDIRRMFNGKVPNWVKEWFEFDFDTILDGEPLWL